MQRLLVLSLCLAACSKSESEKLTSTQLCKLAVTVIANMGTDLEYVISRPNFIVPTEAAQSDDPDRALCERLVFAGAQARGMYRTLWIAHGSMDDPSKSVRLAYDEADKLGHTFSTRLANVDTCLKSTPATLIAELGALAFEASARVERICK